MKVEKPTVLKTGSLNQREAKQKPLRSTVSGPRNVAGSKRRPGAPVRAGMEEYTPTNIRSTGFPEKQKNAKQNPVPIHKCPDACPCRQG